jgi:hypothetical protein
MNKTTTTTTKANVKVVKGTKKDVAPIPCRPFYMG